MASKSFQASLKGRLVEERVDVAGDHIMSRAFNAIDISVVILEGMFYRTPCI